MGTKNSEKKKLETAVLNTSKTIESDMNSDQKPDSVVVKLRNFLGKRPTKLEHQNLQTEYNNLQQELHKSTNYAEKLLKKNGELEEQLAEIERILDSYE